jgi:prepilin-type N-terminal cleavage/methylation domain-containing protein
MRLRTAGLRRGFTLIELMIVVAIIGVLAAIAVPKFAELIRKSNEGKAKGNMGAIRSAIAIYYADMGGMFPTDELSSLTVDTKYLASIPKAHSPNYHAETGAVKNNSDLGCGAISTYDGGAWVYWNDDGSLCGTSLTHHQGDLWIGCAHTDTKGLTWTSY